MAMILLLMASKLSAVDQPNKSLQVSRDCVPFIKSLASQVVATRAAT
jgi:hypothetical protein